MIGLAIWVAGNLWKIVPLLYSKDER
jgi:hypothetical protein